MEMEDIMKQDILDFKNYKFIVNRHQPIKRIEEVKHRNEMIQFIPKEVFDKMLKLSAIKKGKFFTVSGNSYDVIDNRTGERFYKRFEKLSDALEWLNDEK